MKQKSSRLPLLLTLLALVLLTVAWLLPAPEQRRQAKMPASEPVPTAGNSIKILHNPGFSLGYSRARRDPLWVRYEARAVRHSQYHPRPDFAADTRLRDPVQPWAYRGSGYERGHLAPNYLISNLYGVAAQRATFLMSNITPQRPRLNELLWQRLEEIEADALTRRWGPLQVTLGPIFGAHAKHLRDGVAVPTAFYRLWLDHTADGGLRVLALRVPQAVRGDEPLTAFITSVDVIEQATGLDFYSALPDKVEDALEASPADPSAWGFDKLACLPARYADDWRDRGGIRLNYDRCH